jgi:hypothetical protein
MYGWHINYTSAKFIINTKNVSKGIYNIHIYSLIVILLAIGDDS